MAKKDTIIVKGTEITVISDKKSDYISLTDMAGYKDELEARVVVSNWMSTRFTLEFLGIWEEIYNPNFNRMEFHTIKNADGRLVLTPKRWVERTNAIGIFSKSGRYGGGIFAHRDIAFEFGSWLSAEFKFYLIKEFQRLKEEENNQKSLEWNLQRTLSKINYRIHTDAICLNRDFHKIIMIALIIPILLIIKILKIRVQTMESINAFLIRQGLPQGERLVQLNATAITQMRSLLQNNNLQKRLQ